jgi:stage IV sporulation protein FB
MITIPGRIPIRIHPFFWLLIFLIGWIQSQTVLGIAVWSLIILASVIVHEFGHALTAVAFGQQAQIDLIAFGGLTQRHGPVLNLWKEFLIVLNGPLAGIGLFLLALLAKSFLGVPNATLPGQILIIVIEVNLFWTLLNLLPVQPLDGGRLLSIFFEAIFGVKGVKMALFISMTLSAILGLGFFYIGQLFAGTLFMMFMFENFRNWQTSLAFTPHDQNPNLRQLMELAEQDLLEGREEEAFEKFARIRTATSEGFLHGTATQKMAETLAKRGDYQQARELLLSLSSKLSPEALSLLHRLHYLTGHCDETLKMGDETYRSKPGYEVALINAFCYALKGEAQPAVGWLQCAIRDGLPNASAILQRPEFSNIRQDPRFQHLLGRVCKL